MKMFSACKWVSKERQIEVRNPFDGSVIDTVPAATADDVTNAIEQLESGRQLMKAMPSHERAEILRRIAAGMLSREEELARTISAEEGKVLSESRLEAARARQVIELSAEEAGRLYGEVVPLDAAPGVSGKFGFTLTVPCGIVAAITPFNFPLNLVCHKVGPAIAGGNAVLIKPATDTPLSALKLTEIILDAGLPESAIACLTGSGAELGRAVCEDSRIRKISFTGSQEVGEQICRMAGLKRVTMELGSNSPVIVMDDADLELAARAVAGAGFANAGQVCISAQRVFTSSAVHGDFLDALTPLVTQLTPGNQMEETTRMGPMVRESDAKRVVELIEEASNAGADLLTGGTREGALCAPAILDNVDPGMRVSRDELFGPAVTLTRFDSIDEAIQAANDTRFGLSAGIFTRDLNRAMRFAHEVESGNIHINWASQWRADLMPYGGLKDSGLGKEGPRYAIREMTEEKMVVVHM